MKKVFLLAVLAFTHVHAADSLESIKDEIRKKYGQDTLVTRTFLKNLEHQMELNESLEDKDKYIASYKKFGRSRQCLLFLLNHEELHGFREIVMKLDQLPFMKDFHKKDFKMLMNRDVRSKVRMDFGKTPIEERYQKYCDEKISEEVLSQIIASKHADNKKQEDEQKRLEAEYELSNFEDAHPLLRNILLEAQKDFLKRSKDVSPMQIDQQVQMAFAMVIAPTLNTKANLEIIPKIEKKCPGKTEEAWKKCEGKKYYDNPIQQKLQPGLVRLLCLNDHKANVVPNCIEEKELRVGKSN